MPRSPSRPRTKFFGSGTFCGSDSFLPVVILYDWPLCDATPPPGGLTYLHKGIPMTDRLTHRGARQLTAAIDDVAQCIQENHQLLGIDSKIAQDFAYRCDLISDAVEGRATENFGKQADFDAGSIGEIVPGPLVDGEQEGEKDFAGHFTQVEGQELQDLEMSKMASAIDAVLAAEDSKTLIAAMETVGERLAARLPEMEIGKMPGFSPMQTRQHIDRLADLRRQIIEHQAQFEESIKRLKDLEAEEKKGLDALKKAAVKLDDNARYVLEAENALLKFTASSADKVPGIAQMIARADDSKWGDKAGDFFGRIAKQFDADVAKQIEVIYEQTKSDLTHTTMAVRGLKVVAKTASMPATTARTAGIADMAVSIKNWLSGAADRVAERILGFAGDVKKWLQGFDLRSKMVRKSKDSILDSIASFDRQVDKMMREGKTASAEPTSKFDLTA